MSCKEGWKKNVQRHIKDIGGKTAHPSVLGTLLEQEVACISSREESRRSLPDILLRTHIITVRPHSGSWACALLTHLVDRDPHPRKALTASWLHKAGAELRNLLDLLTSPGERN